MGTVESLRKKPEVNAMVICDCKNTTFKVGIKTDGIENHIRLLTCTACGHHLPVPFQPGEKTI